MIPDLGYIEQSLGANETLLERAHFPWFYHLAAWATLAVGFAVAAISLERGFGVWLAVSLAMAGLVACVSIILQIRTTEIGVTSHRLIVKRGILARHTDEIELWAIEEVNLSQGVLGRMLDYGRIEVQGTGDDSLPIPTIAGPLRFRKAIESAIGQAVRPAKPSRNRNS